VSSRLTVYWRLAPQSRDEQRVGGKHPGQRKALHGVMVGYAEGMPAYRIWDPVARIRNVSYAFTIAHEGYYPFKDKGLWTEEMKKQPASFEDLSNEESTDDEAMTEGVARARRASIDDGEHVQRSSTGG